MPENRLNNTRKVYSPDDFIKICPYCNGDGTFESESPGDNLNVDIGICIECNGTGKVLKDESK